RDGIAVGPQAGIVVVGREVVVIAVACRGRYMAVDGLYILVIAEIELAHLITHRVHIPVALAAVQVVLGRIGRYVDGPMAFGNVVTYVQVGMQVGQEGKR